MGKDTEIKLVGQPIFKQVLDLIERVNIPGLVKKHSADRYYKAFQAKTQLTLLTIILLIKCPLHFLKIKEFNFCIH